jgi:putative component of toxin-antitoxin plasmid stabilization module
LTFVEVLGLASNLPAADATFAEVVSLTFFVDMMVFLAVVLCGRWKVALLITNLYFISQKSDNIKYSLQHMNNNVIISEWTLWEYLGAYTSFIEGCDASMRASIENRLERLMQLGNEAREPISKPVRDGIFELRSQRGGRLLYYFRPGKKIIVVLGFVKDQRKLLEADIKLALQRRQQAEAEQEKANVIVKIH